MDIFSPTILDNALITGSNNANLLQVSSPSAPSTLFISGSGNVGIGTTTPVHNLVVDGNTGISINANGTTFPNIHRDSTDGGMLLRSWNGSTFTNNVKITPTSNVGIGTTSPTQRLDVRDGFIQVSGSGASGYGYLLNRAGQDTYSIRHLDGGLTINNETDSVKEMTFLGNGNIGINEINPSARLEIKGSGVTSATTAFRVENSNASASLVVRDDGNVGIGTTSPSAQLHISGSATIPLRVQNPATTLMQISSSATNSGSIVFFGTTPTSGLDLEIQSNGAANGGQVRIAGNGTQWDFGSVSAVVRNGTGNPEMFGATMTGTSTTLVQNPFRVQFNANQSSAGGGGYTVLRVNATHATTAGTGSKLLQTWEFGGNAQSVIDISGSLGIGTGSAPNARLFVSGANNQSLLRVSSPSASAALFVQGDGNVGIGTETPTGVIDVVQGGNSKILVTAGSGIGSGFVGLQQSSPAEYIHITSDPAGTKYIQIDAASSQTPPTTAIVPDTGYGNTSNKIYLAEPDYWMEIKLNGNIVLIPCYLPA